MAASVLQHRPQRSDFLGSMNVVPLDKIMVTVTRVSPATLFLIYSFLIGVHVIANGAQYDPFNIGDQPPRLGQPSSACRHLLIRPRTRPLIGCNYTLDLLTTIVFQWTFNDQ
jgi:hypothetical protein